MKALAGMCLAIVLASLTNTVSAEDVLPQMTLPDILAVELPPGVQQIGPNESPLRELLAGAKSGTYNVTSDLQRKVGPGPVLVTWIAWDSPAKARKVVAINSAHIFVLP